MNPQGGQPSQRTKKDGNSLPPMDNALLIELGFGSMPSILAKSLLDEIKSELELRVGRALSSGMPDADLEEFEDLYEDNEAATQWLEAHVPDYRKTVKHEHRGLMAEIAKSAPQVLRILKSQNETKSDLTKP